MAIPPLPPNRLGCPPKSVCADFVAGRVNSAGFGGVPQEVGVAVLGVNEGKPVGSVKRGAEGPGVVVGAIAVVTTFSAGLNSDSVEAGVVVGGNIEVTGFSPGAGDNDKTGGVLGRDELAYVGCGGGGGGAVHWPKGSLGAVGCITIAGGADLEMGGDFSTSPSRTMGVLASGELRIGRLFERGARPKGEVGGGEALSVGTGICTGAEGVSLTGEPGGVVPRSLTGDTRGTPEGEGV